MIYIQFHQLKEIIHLLDFFPEHSTASAGKKVEVFAEHCISARLLAGDLKSIYIKATASRIKHKQRARIKAKQDAQRATHTEQMNLPGTSMPA